MDVQYQRCAGLDVQKRTVVACVRLTTAQGEGQQEVRTFGTMTADLLALADWLAGYAVEQVAMESTGVYWRPVFNVLEAQHAVVRVNPQHMRAVPGRKTDVKDAEWLADLLAHGLLQPRFIPPAPVRALRELVGSRRQHGAGAHAGDQPRAQAARAGQHEAGRSGHRCPGQERAGDAPWLGGGRP